MINIKLRKGITLDNFMQTIYGQSIPDFKDPSMRNLFASDYENTKVGIKCAKSHDGYHALLNDNCDDIGEYEYVYLSVIDFDELFEIRLR